ncbi:MAG: glycosyl hydrolase [Bacteroidota bacterium]
METAPTRMLVCTNKGLIVYRLSPTGWVFQQKDFVGLPISQALVDPHTGRWWVALAHKHWGQKLHRSDDEGRTWQELAAPRYPKGSEAKPGVPASLKLMWALAAGEADQPGRLYVGTEPGGLFRSEDGGEHFELIESLWNHPSRPKHWFGGGRNFAGIHSIVVDPRDSSHYYIAVSCAGVFETRDDGASWQVRNQGLRADYLPNPHAEVGQDPHLLLACHTQPDILWQQNHCGIFRSVDGGQLWEDVTDENGLANYGFALAIDHENPLRAWVIPATSDRIRVAVDQALCVCRTEDGGKSWEALRTGLPQENCFDIIFRHALARRGPHLAFGTTTGNLFVSDSDGDHWQNLSHFLPMINAVLFA